MGEEEKNMAENQQGGASENSMDSLEGTTSNKQAEELAKDLAAAQSRIQELENLLKRTLADFDNYRKRTAQEKEAFLKFATEKLITNLLPVVDNFERALQSAEQNQDVASLKTGIEMVYKQLSGELAKAGLETLETQGQKFDPNLHDAAMQRPAEAPEGTILETYQKGYKLGDKVIRHAMVVVSAGGGSAEEQKD